LEFKKMMERSTFLKCLGAALSVGPRLLSAEVLSVDCAFPGGNVVVERIEDDHVYLRPDLRDTEGHWFYWNFRVRGAAGRTLAFNFNGGPAIGVMGPAVSLDGGRSWNWLGKEAVEKETFRFAFPSGVDEVRFCLSIPYLEADLNRFLASHRGSRRLRREVLCETGKGRRVELIRIAQPGLEYRRRALITARHHCCEMIASYSMEGLMDFLLADAPDGNWLRQNVEFAFVPFMDKDGVEDGDQGKNRRPHDHNRDYAGRSIYPSVRALREFVTRWSGGKLEFALDMHCPWLKGDLNEHVYFVGGRVEKIWNEVLSFSRILEQVRIGPIPYRASGNVPYGTAWNTAKNTPGSLKSFGMWASELPGIRLATSIEIPYANAKDTTITAEAARALGADLGRAMRRYLEGRGA
jgi:hypothetical protein